MRTLACEESSRHSPDEDRPVAKSLGGRTADEELGFAHEGDRFSARTGGLIPASQPV